MRNGKFEAGDFPFDEQPWDSANTLIPQLLTQLAGDGEGFTASDFDNGISDAELENLPFSNSDIKGKKKDHVRIFTDLANTKLQALRAKDRSEIERLREENKILAINGSRVQDMSEQLGAMEAELEEYKTPRSDVDRTDQIYTDACVGITIINEETARLREQIVYGDNQGIWGKSRGPFDTHTARVTSIEEINRRTSVE